ncbi:MAG: hypothetical protein J6Q94_03755 [Clostridia bacterium]|nr:hypothetical protein [Clostridia bacterium]
MTIIYGIVLVISLLMIGICYHVDRKRDISLMLLFISIAVCNLGYFLMTLATNLDFALWANRISYLGNVFLPCFMLMMIIQLSGYRYPKIVPRILIAINIVMLLITISGGILPIYYKDVAFEIINGIPTLIKEYGPLHNFYKVYLFGYFGAMVVVIIKSTITKTCISNKHAAFLAFLVITNISIWLAENLLDAEFEFLSVSYIITEGLILFIYAILQDYGLLDTKFIEEASEKTIPEVNKTQNTIYGTDMPCKEIVRFFTQEQIDNIFSCWDEIEKLSQRECEVLRYILANEKRHVIAEELFVTESTIKKHTSNIFRKLEISSRAELFEKAMQFTHSSQQ